MSSRFFPHSQLKIRSGIPVVVVSGFHIQLLDASTGAVVSSTLNAPENVQETLKKSGPIRCVVLDNSNTHLATLADDKKLKVWKLDGLELLHERELPKRPTSAAFTSDGQSIVVADKFGDVFHYPLHPPPADSVAVPESAGSKLTSLHAAESDEPVQDSPEAAVVESSAESSSSKKRKSKKKKEKLIENPPAPRNSLASHVNTSNGTLVLGHTSLLTYFLLTPDSKYIITADRDEHIRVSWYPQGFCIESFCLGHTQFVSAIHLPSAHPHILISGGGDAELKVWDWLSGKHKFDISILEFVRPYIKVKVKPYKRTRYADGEEQNNEGDGIQVEDPASVNNEEQAVLAVQKITTLSESILFSVTGGTALFAVAYTDDVPSSPLIHVLDFGKPILDFTTSPDSLIWVNVDLNWSENGDVATSGNAVRVAKLDNNGQFVHVSSTSPLLDALNLKCLIQATDEDLSSLNFYSALTSLPKNTGEFDADEEDHGSAGAASYIGTGIPKHIKTNTRKQSQGPGGGKKEQGKLKTQKAVAEKKKKLGVDEDTPNSKRLKSEETNAQGVDTDLQMLDVSTVGT
ncbi:WD40-repeat-containing domain protein [Rhodocollybia butyracea]|uniref:WD40-repeat-containing domain protein n=1 Tax=Rhodocollybia butyracea TaxID=206335 RepID=A0A9P5PPL5_9AGAR|nr:WD40-repeat-containing domain protein [Rhodocollybia butyracea]